MSCLFSYCLNSCKHFYEGKEGIHCKAFPKKEIPKDILWRIEEYIDECNGNIKYEKIKISTEQEKP